MSATLVYFTESSFFSWYPECVQWLIGIDEAGRGALAGPVSVGACLIPADLDWREGFSLITKRGPPKLRDSKKMSAQQREILFGYIEEHARIRHASALVSAETIDAIGIANAAREAAAIALTQLSVHPTSVKILLDAGLSVPEMWDQESFVKGDERIPAISYASIVAKVTRDRYMEDIALKHAPYGFDAHKGYGTHAHFLAIRKHGMVPNIHRRTFLTAL